MSMFGILLISFSISLSPCFCPPHRESHIPRQDASRPSSRKVFPRRGLPHALSKTGIAQHPRRIPPSLGFHWADLRSNGFRDCGSKVIWQGLLPHHHRKCPHLSAFVPLTHFHRPPHAFQIRFRFTPQNNKEVKTLRSRARRI